MRGFRISGDRWYHVEIIGVIGVVTSQTASQAEERKIVEPILRSIRARKAVRDANLYEFMLRNPHPTPAAGIMALVDYFVEGFDDFAEATLVFARDWLNPESISPEYLRMLAGERDRILDARFQNFAAEWHPELRALVHGKIKALLVARFAWWKGIVELKLVETRAEWERARGALMKGNPQPKPRAKRGRPPLYSVSQIAAVCAIVLGRGRMTSETLKATCQEIDRLCEQDRPEPPVGDTWLEGAGKSADSIRHAFRHFRNRLKSDTNSRS